MGQRVDHCLPGRWLGPGDGALCILGFLEDTVKAIEKEKIGVWPHVT